MHQLLLDGKFFPISIAQLRDYLGINHSATTQVF